MVPTAAFATHECLPVTALDHSNHMFWLGSSVAGVLIDLRTMGIERTAESRFVPSNTLIPDLGACAFV